MFAAVWEVMRSLTLRSLWTKPKSDSLRGAPPPPSIPPNHPGLQRDQTWLLRGVTGARVIKKHVAFHVGPESRSCVLHVLWMWFNGPKIQVWLFPDIKLPSVSSHPASLPLIQSDTRLQQEEVGEKEVETKEEEKEEGQAGRVLREGWVHPEGRRLDGSGSQQVQREASWKHYRCPNKLQWAELGADSGGERSSGAPRASDAHQVLAPLKSEGKRCEATSWLSQRRREAIWPERRVASQPSAFRTVSARLMFETGDVPSGFDVVLKARQESAHFN